MISLIVFFFILAVLAKIVGDHRDDARWYGASAVCFFITVVLLVIWAVEFHGDAIGEFLRNY